MKRLLLLCLALHFIVSSSAQYTDTTVSKPQTDYLTKSKKQMSSAWILLGGGAALTIIGIIIIASEASDLDFESDAITVGEVMSYTGLAAMVGSIPFFIASARNKRKAATTMSFKMEKAAIVGVRDISIKRYPAVALQIHW